MRGRPYTPTKLYIDSPGWTPACGEYIRSSRSAYLITGVTPSKAAARQPGWKRYNLRVLRWPVAEIEEGAPVVTMEWHKRRKKARR